MKSEQRCLWMSRMSFLVSAAALASFGYRELSDAALPQKEGNHVGGLAQTVSAAALTPLVNADGYTSPHPSQVTPREATGPTAAARRYLDRIKQGFRTEPASQTATANNSELGPAFVDPGVPSGPLAPVKVKRLVVTKAVEGREPVEVSETVSRQAPVFAFVELATGSGTEQNLVVSFEHEAGDSTGVVNLSVPANQTRWRTWGRTRKLDRDGRWTAVVRDGRGAVLGRTEFTVRSAS